MEARGIDPRTSHMLSERSTIWATPPLVFEGYEFITLYYLFKQFPAFFSLMRQPLVFEGYEFITLYYLFKQFPAFFLLWDSHWYLKVINLSPCIIFSNNFPPFFSYETASSEKTFFCCCPISIHFIIFCSSERCLKFLDCKFLLNNLLYLFISTRVTPNLLRLCIFYVDTLLCFAIIDFLLLFFWLKLLPNWLNYWCLQYRIYICVKKNN